MGGIPTQEAAAYLARRAAGDRDEVSRLRTALEFYAEPSNWRSPSSGFALPYDPAPSPVNADRGNAARRALGREVGA